MTLSQTAAGASASNEQQVADLLSRMTLEEKVGQMRQAHAGDGEPAALVGDEIRAGRVGSS